MVWQLVIGYVLISQITVACWLGFSWRYCEEHDVRDAYQGLSWRQKVWCLIFVGMVLLVLAPFMLPWMSFGFYHCYRQESAEEKKLFRTYQELMLDPLHHCNIPEELLDYMEEHTSAPVALGYEQLGDFWLKEEPFNSKARIFLHPDGIAFVEIGVTWGCLYCETISFLEDGTVVGMANCQPFKRMQLFAENQYYMKTIPDGDLLELLEEHVQYVDEISAENDVPVCRIPESDWKPYYHYHNRRFGQIRFELGEIDEPPANSSFPRTSNDEELRSDDPTGIHSTVAN